MRRVVPNPVVSGGEALAQMSPIGFQKDFCFDVKGKEYFCSRFIACYVSALVARFSAFDVSFDRLFVDVDDSCGMFGRILDFAEGGSIDLSSKDIDLSTLLKLSVYIENDELIRGILDVRWPCQELCVDNVLGRVSAKLSERLPIDDEVSFLSSHFKEVVDHHSSDSSFNLLSVLGYDVSYQVLCDRHFETDDHDMLVDLILGSGKSFLPLLEFVKLERCSADATKKLHDELLVLEMNSGIWHAIRRRLVLDLLAATPSPAPKKIEEPAPPKPRCTYEAHGRAFVSQKFYHCLTCGLVGNLGMCEACMQVCHAGHRITGGQYVPEAFCDCGDGAKGCQCQICDRR